MFDEFYKQILSEYLLTGLVCSRDGKKTYQYSEALSSAYETISSSMLSLDSRSL